MDAKELISQNEVKKSVQALLQVKSLADSKEKKPLFGDESNVNLQFALKKMVTSQQTIKLKLPNGLEEMNKEVCLFVRDLDKTDREYEKSARHFKQKLKAEGVTCVSQIIPLKALKLEYKPFEAKRKLSNSFDIFLADARIIRLLPAYLGKAFYGKKRQPVQVRMDSKDLKGEFEAAIGNSRCILSGKGPVGMAVVGTTSMSAAELVQNISASAEQIAAAVPGGPVNIRSMYIKTKDSLALPIYTSIDSANEVQLPKTKKKQEAVVVDEVTTVERGLVKVLPSGIVRLVDNSGKVIKPKVVKLKKPAKAVKRAGKRGQKPLKGKSKSKKNLKDAAKKKKVK